MLCQMVESRQRMGFASAKLRDQRHDRRRIVGSPRQSAQHHAHVLAQGAGEAGPGEEFHRITVVVRTSVGSHLLKGNGEFVGIERASLSNFGAGDGVFVPRFHVDVPNQLAAQSFLVLSTSSTARMFSVSKSMWS